ncbi:YheV family putative zinc ribbon protein [Vibrio viridaestus]|uniref:YheV family putative zinc ribbon protein n=1 Tax=Vibrio viridaestus TaxID=2487322 RepID=UPI001AA038D5|nr:YheV family putative zinc ribbon protein [Vibrio viridaestus]
MKTKKRFIAGAKCPQCESADSLRWWSINNIEYVECVECDYHEQRVPKSLEISERQSEEMIGFFKPE